MVINTSQPRGMTVGDWTSMIGHELVHVGQYANHTYGSSPHDYWGGEMEAYAWQASHVGAFGPQNVFSEAAIQKRLSSVTSCQARNISPSTTC